MMSSKVTAKTKCPVCSKKYIVPTSACGHRVRCSECHTVFRVPKQDNLHPTEDDIMRWLSEVQEEPEVRLESHQEDHEHEHQDHEHPAEHEHEHELEHPPVPGGRPPVKVELSDTHIHWRRTA